MPGRQRARSLDLGRRPPQEHERRWSLDLDAPRLDLEELVLDAQDHGEALVVEPAEEEAEASVDGDPPVHDLQPLDGLRQGLLRGTIDDRRRHYRAQIRPVLVHAGLLRNAFQVLVQRYGFGQSLNDMLALSALYHELYGDLRPHLQPEQWDWVAEENVQDQLMGMILNFPQAIQAAVMRRLGEEEAFVRRLTHPDEIDRERFNAFTLAIHRNPGAVGFRDFGRVLLDEGVRGEARVRAGQLATGVAMPLKENRDDPVVDRDWKDKHVDRVVGVVDALPIQHTAENEELKGLVRAKKERRHNEELPWGWYVQNQPDNRAREKYAYVGGNSKAFTTTDWVQRDLFGREKKRQLAGANDPLHEVQSRFDHVLRHEIGHAVDHLIGASTTWGTTPQGGGWETLAGADAVADRARAGFLDHCGPALDVLTGEARLARDAAEDLLVDAMRLSLAGDGRVHRHLSDAAGWENVPRNRRGAVRDAVRGLDAVARVRSMCKGTHAIADDEVPGFGDDAFHRTDGRWYRYALAARERKVSRYQFHAPEEWFAEAYAAFYEPAGDLGAVLRGADPVTWAWFRASVHDSRAALQIEAVREQADALQTTYELLGEQGFEGEA